MTNKEKLFKQITDNGKVIATFRECDLHPIFDKAILDLPVGASLRFTGQTRIERVE